MAAMKMKASQRKRAAPAIERRQRARRGRRPLYAALCALLVGTSAARAADKDITELSLEELSDVKVYSPEVSVYSASKFTQKLSKAPANVTVITAAEIKAFGYRKLIDILRSIPGLYGTYDRNYDFLGVRGFERPGDFNSRILLLLDGIRLNENVYNQAALGTENIIDVDLIERVEWIPGPGSSIYGNNAFFGVISIISKSGSNYRAAEAVGSVASAKTTSVRGTYGQVFDNGLEMLLSATNYDSKGTDLFFPQYKALGYGDGVAHNLDYDRAYNVFAKASFEGFTFEAAYSDRKKGLPTGAYGTLFDLPNTYTIDQQSLFDLHYSGSVTEGLDVLARAYYRWYNYDGNYPYQSDNGVIENVDGSRGRWAGLELKFVQTSFEHHKLVYGAEYQNNFVQRQFNFDRDPYYLYNDASPRSTTYAVYGQDEWSLSDQLILNAGLRYDTVGNYKGNVNPRVAAIYSPTETTTLKLVYGSAFRAPNAYETYYQQANLWKVNPNLTSEKIKTYEAILEHYFANNLRVSASLFEYRINNLIEQVTDPADGLLMFSNVSKVETKGGQLIGEAQWDNGVKARASYSYQRAKDVDTGMTLTNSPEQLAKLNVVAPVYAGVRIGWETLYTGPRKTTMAQVGGYTVTNVTLLSPEWVKGLEISGSVYNLFNKTFFDPSTPDLSAAGLDSIQQDGRTFRLKLSYRF